MTGSSDSNGMRREVGLWGRCLTTILAGVIIAAFTALASVAVGNMLGVAENKTHVDTLKEGLQRIEFKVDRLLLDRGLPITGPERKVP